MRRVLLQRGHAAIGLDRSERYLKEYGFSQRMIESYLRVAEFFLDKYGEPTSTALAAYKEQLEKSYKPTTVNQRTQAINRYLGHLG